MNESVNAWSSYQQLCDRPNVFTRWLLQQTLEILQQSNQSLLGERIEQTLNEHSPLAKPRDHRGDTRSDVYMLNLTLAEARAIARCVESAEQEGLVTRATAKRGLGGFSATWKEYVTFLGGSLD